MRSSSRLDPIFLLSLCITVGVLLYTSWGFVSLMQTQSALSSQTEKKQQQEEQLQQYLEEQKETLALYDQFTLGGELLRKRRNWSKVLQEVENTFPGYSILHNFEASEEENATLTVSTASYDDIVRLIRIIQDKNPVFSDVFIPAIAATEDQEGNAYFTLPFELTFSDTNTYE